MKCEEWIGNQPWGLSQEDHSDRLEKSWNASRKEILMEVKKLFATPKMSGLITCKCDEETVSDVQLLNIRNLIQKELEKLK